MSALVKWHPLELFDARFAANIEALSGRDAALAARLSEVRLLTPFCIAAEGDNVLLGRQGAAGVEVVPNPLPPLVARDVAGNLFPQGAVNGPVAIAGLGYGWLWDRVAKLPCRMEAAPGHRPPIYLLTGNIERLWAVLHVLDWRQMLADQRFPLFVGPEAATQFRQALIDRPSLPLPAAWVSAEPQLWPQDFNFLLKGVTEGRSRQMDRLRARVRELYPAVSPAELAERLGAGKLRVLGITSRYTTFLQYSMRDWLSGFERLGHETKLIMETADHEVTTPLGIAEACADFRPDLVVLIDHYRAEFAGLPEHVPCVMWVQDRLPNIFSESGGRNQTDLDYCVGFGRLHLSSRFGYPADRFMPSTIGINDQKYARSPLSPEDVARYGCDVSYVSHASTPSDALIRKELGPSPSPEASRLLWDFHDRMVAHFEGGGHVLTEPVLRRRLIESMRQTRVDLDPAGVDDLIGFFSQQVNNAIFRHQALLWVADLGVDLRLYGRGWEAHPHLSRFARGVADNQSELPKIYLASKINLQLIPHGVMHQRLLDGLSAGGFFLIRYTPGDAIGGAYRQLWEWCRGRGIQCDADMRARADEQARHLIDRVDELLGYDSAAAGLPLYDCLQTVADDQFMSLASAVWPFEYPQVAFADREELRSKLTRYLGDDAARTELAGAMRRVVVDRCSYRSINQRLLQFIMADLSRRESRSAEATTARAAA